MARRRTPQTRGPGGQFVPVDAPDAIMKAEDEGTTTDPFGEVGVTGVSRQGGIIWEEWLPQLQGEKAVKVYREMSDNDPVVGAMLYTLGMILRSADWTVEPADVENPEAEAVAEFVDECMHDMSQSWGDFVAEVLSMLTFGWSFHEIVYKRREGREAEVPSAYNDGRIGWRKLPIRSQDTLSRWEFDEHGGVDGMYQMAVGQIGETYMPIEKGLLFRTNQHKNNPEGRSILRTAYTSWWRKKRIEQTEGIGIERDLAGLPLIGIPSEHFSKKATGDQQAALQQWMKIGENLRNDDQSCVVYPLAYDEKGNQRTKIELMSTGGRRMFDTTAVIERYSRYIAMSVLGDVVLLGHERVGSLALSETKMAMFYSAMRALLDQIANIMSDFAIPRLLRLNAMALDLTPRLVPGSLEQIDLEKLAQSVLTLAQSGMAMFPSEEMEAYVRSTFGWPEAEPLSPEEAAAQAGVALPNVNELPEDELENLA